MSTRATWAILPVKALALAKQRLAPVLPAAARRELTLFPYTTLFRSRKSVV